MSNIFARIEEDPAPQNVPDSISSPVACMPPRSSSVSHGGVLLQRPVVPGMVSRARAAEIQEAQQNRTRQREHAAASPSSETCRRAGEASHMRVKLSGCAVLES